MAQSITCDSCGLDDDEEYLASIGHSLSLAVNEITDILHTFYLNVVQEE